MHTTWTGPDEAYENAVHAYADAVLDDEELARLGGRLRRPDWTPAPAAHVLGQKLVQLTMPGVPDVYQGTEIVDLSLVDPDNRRDRRLRRAPRAAGRGWTPATGRRDLDDEKLLVTSRALRLRREHPEWFVGARRRRTRRSPTSTGNAVAFGRGARRRGVAVVAVATRLPVALERHGGWARAHARAAGGRLARRADRPETPGRHRAGSPTCSPTCPVALLVAAPDGSPMAGPSAAQAGLLGLDVEVGRRPLRVDLLEGVEQQLLHRPPRVPLAVRRHDVPRRGVGRAAGQRGLVGLLVVVPAQPLVDVAGVVLPVLVRAVRAARRAAPSARRARCAA